MPLLCFLGYDLSCKVVSNKAVDEFKSLTDQSADKWSFRLLKERSDSELKRVVSNSSLTS